MSTKEGPHKTHILIPESTDEEFSVFLRFVSGNKIFVIKQVWL